MHADKLSYRLPSFASRASLFLAGVGGAALVAGFFLKPTLAWPNLLLISNYLLGLGLAGLVVVALHDITGARWSRQIRPVAAAMSAILPFAAVGLMVVFLCRPSLYEWTHRTGGEPQSPLQHLWLNRPFFLLRAIVYLGVWIAFAGLVLRDCMRSPDDHHPSVLGKNVRRSALFLVVFGITCWLSSYDWLMSLEPEWSSTIYSVYNFAGLFLSGLAALVLIVLALRGRTPGQDFLNKDQLHDLGTLVFAFSSFWMYTWFCQYMLIWYVNNPEEAAYYKLRLQGAWPQVMLLDIALNWGIPFVVLLFRSAKRSPLVLGTVAAMILIGRVVDLALMILPSPQIAEVPLPGFLEAAPILGALGLFVMAMSLVLGKANLRLAKTA